MSGSLSAQLIESHNPQSPWNSSVVSHGPMSFNPMMHGTPYAQQSFTLFGSQGSPTFGNDSISEETATKIANLQIKLNRKLGPEYISQRPGPGGGPKLTYVEGWKIINLANEVFGFNGWSSSTVSLTTDFVDYSEETRRYCVGVTAIIRVTLRDGVHHEDIGYGMLENAKSKGAALDKCKKEAVTDGLKRALRNFGNVLGNCLYDKSYTAEVVKVKVEQPKFDKEALHRRPEFQDVKPAITSSTSTPSTNQPQPQLANIGTTNNYATPTRQPMQQPKPNTSLPPHMRSEVQQSISNFSSSSSRQPTNQVHAARNPPQTTGLNTPMTTPQTHRPAAQPQAPTQRHVTFNQPTTSSVSSSTTSALSSVSSSNVPPPPAPAHLKTEQLDLDSDDTFGLDDADFLALADADLGPPIGEGDIGRPIDQEEGLLRMPEEEGDRDECGDVVTADQQQSAQRSTTTIQSAQGSGSMSRSLSREEIIAAALQSKDEANGSVSVSMSRLATNHPAAGLLTKQTPPPLVRNSSASSSSSSLGSMRPPPPPPQHQQRQQHQQYQNQNPRPTSLAQQRHQQYTILRQEQQQQQQQQQNHNRNENINPATGGTNQTHAQDNHKTSATNPEHQVTKPRPLTPSMGGGFNFPQGMNPSQLQSQPQPIIGVKRPADAMASNNVSNTSFRGGPGMGLQQKQLLPVSGMSSRLSLGPRAGQRQVLGALAVGEGGDVKRMKR